METTSIYCTHCSSELAPETKFCTGCGKGVDQPITYPQYNTEVQPIYAAPQQQVPIEGTRKALPALGIVGGLLMIPLFLRDFVVYGIMFDGIISALATIDTIFIFATIILGIMAGITYKKNRERSRRHFATAAIFSGIDIAYLIIFSPFYFFESPLSVLMIFPTLGAFTCLLIGYLLAKK